MGDMRPTRQGGQVCLVRVPSRNKKWRRLLHIARTLFTQRRDSKVSFWSTFLIKVQISTLFGTEGTCHRKERSFHFRPSHAPERYLSDTSLGKKCSYFYRKPTLYLRMSVRVCVLLWGRKRRIQRLEFTFFRRPKQSLGETNELEELEIKKWKEKEWKESERENKNVVSVTWKKGSKENVSRKVTSSSVSWAHSMPYVGSRTKTLQCSSIASVFAARRVRVAEQP